MAISGTYEDFGDFGLIDGNYLVPAGESLKAKSGDKVNAETIDGNESCYVITSININSEINKTAELIEGVLTQTNKDFGFVESIGTSKGVYVRTNNMHGAISGDRVNIILNNVGKKIEGIVTNIISYGDGLLVGDYINKNGKHFVESEIGGKSNIFPVVLGSGIEIGEGDVVSFKLDRNNPENIFGTIKNILGKQGEKGVDILKIAVGEGARLEFPETVLNETEDLNEEIDNAEIEKREDLRELFTITIDGADSKDLDDAISIEKLSDDKFKLYVHIADVTHYVTENSNLDTEALIRGTSIYLVDKVIPMLPEKLSNNLCSLNANTDKLSMTCEMVIDKNGYIDFDNSKVYESVINSNFRMTYKEVQSLSDKNNLKQGDELMFGGLVNKELTNIVSNSNVLANLLNKKLKNNGELNFDFDETKVIVDEKGNPTGFEAYTMYDSNDWIKAFMVSANETVSKLYEDYPFLHRTHTKPGEESIIKLNEILKIYNITSDISDLSPKSISNLLDEIKGNEAEKFLSKAVLLTMHRANYTSTREGHYGLALEHYSHFTSPIRRYPDLQIHRIIKEVLSGNYDDTRKTYYEENLSIVAEQSSLLERASNTIETKINSLMAVKYMSDKIGEEFKGYISIIENDKVLVELENTINGIVNIDGDLYDFSKLCEGLYELVDKNGEKISVGKNITLKLASIDEANLRIFFDLVI